MKLLLRACLVLGMLVTAMQVVAAPLFTPFLSVDVNGANYGGGQTVGPTEAGFLAFNTFSGFDQLDPAYNPAEDWGLGGPPNGLTKVFATSEGNITANLIGVGQSLSARNRGANTGGMSGLQQDFAFAQRDGAFGYGRNFIKLKLSGLTPNTTYEFTGFAREAAFQGAELADPNAPGQSYQAWSDLYRLGGQDGPAAWLDSHVGTNASYQPVFTDHDNDVNTPPVDTGYKNPIPILDRSQVAGPDALSQVDTFFHSASFFTTSDAAGMVTVYTWSDPNGFGNTVQGASLLNGFQLSPTPEPTSLVLFGLGLVGLAFRRRR
jgi:hypothetical protein